MDNLFEELSDSKEILETIVDPDELDAFLLNEMLNICNS